MFAIAITLLVLELHVPHVNGSLLAALGRMWPTYAAYVVSFLTIGIIWINHHSLFDRLIRLDRSLLFLNLVFLMTVSVLPFPTAILSEYLLASQGPTAAMVYTLNMAVMGSTFSAMWLYVARRPHLLANTETTEDYTGFLVRSSVGAPIYLAAAFLALFDTRITLVICAALAIYYVSLPAPGQLRHHTTDDPPSSSSDG